MFIPNLYASRDKYIACDLKPREELILQATSAARSPRYKSRPEYI